MYQIKKVAVIGAGTMGARIALVMANHGYQVSIYSRSEETLQKAKSLLESSTFSDLIEYTTDLDTALCEADFISESIAENITLKQQIWKKIEEQVSSECLLTTNTSSVSITLIASVLTQPERLVGMHWFNPADIMPMIEIIKGEQTSEVVSTRVADLCQNIDKEVVFVNKDIPGFIVNRLQYAMLREALFLVTSGIGSIEDVDLAVERTLAPRWSAMGPMKLMDFAGLDTVEKVSSILLSELDNSTELPKWLKEKIASGHLGVKSDNGFYPWTPESASEAMYNRDKTIKMLLSGGKIRE